MITTDDMVTSPETSILHSIPAEELEPMLAGLERRRFAPGAVVVGEGDQLHELYIVRSGIAKLYVATRQGEGYVGRIRPGEAFGEMSVLMDKPAAATLKAASVLELLVMPRRDLEELAERHPVIYRNLGSVLSDRLDQASRGVHQSAGLRLCILEDHGAPALLPFALACSAAWHRREPVLLVALSARPSKELGPRASVTLDRLPAPGRDRPARADLLLAEPRGQFARETLRRTVEEFGSRYGLVLVAGPPGTLPDLPPSSRVRLVPSGSEEFSALGPARVTLRAWADGGGRLGPDSSRVVSVPELDRVDIGGLDRGLLSPTGATGRAVGWAARDLCQLKVGLALGAGSIRGYAHFGVVRVLERIGVPIDSLAGTSVGAAAAALVAIGRTGEDGIAALDSAAQNLYRPTLPTRSFLSIRGLRAVVQEIAGERRIEELPVPLGLVAADLLTMREVVFRRGSLWRAVLASMAIPGVYPAQCVGRYALVDGGVVNPVPTSVVADIADVVVAVDLGRSSVVEAIDGEAEPSPSDLGPPMVVSTIVRSLELMQSRIAPPSSDSTILVCPEIPELRGGKLKNFAAGAQLVAAGEEAAETAVPALAKALPWLRR